MAAFFLCPAVAAQQENSLPPVPAPDTSPVETKPLVGADNARKDYRDSYLSGPSVRPEYRCARGVYSDRCHQVDSRVPRDPSVLFKQAEFYECRGGFLRPGTECFIRVRSP